MSAIVPIFSALSGAQKRAAIALALPTLAVAVASDFANTTTLETGLWTPSVNDFLVVFAFSRDGDASTHDSLAASGFTCTLTQRKTTVANLTNYVRTSVWTGQVTASAEGKLTLTASAAQFQQAIVALLVRGTRSLDQSGAAQNATGTTLNIPLDATPDTGALSITGLCQDGTAGTFACTGHAAIGSAAGTSSDLKWDVFAKLGTPTDPIAWTGLENNKPHAGAGVTIL